MNNKPNTVCVISMKCAFCFIYNRIPVQPKIKNAKAKVKLIRFLFFMN